MNKFIKNIDPDIIYGLCIQLINVVLAITLSSILTRVLDNELFGEFQTILSIVALSNIFSIGFNKSSSVGASKGYDHILNLNITKGLKLNLFILLFCLVLASYFYYLDDLYWMKLLFIFPIFSLSFLFNNFSHYLNGKQKFNHFRLFSLGIGILRLITLGLAAYFYKNVIILILADLCVNIIVNIFVLYYSNRNFVDKKIRKDKILEKQLQTLSNRFSLLAIFNFLATKIEKIILGLIDPVSLSIYYTGMIIPSTIKNNIKSVLVIPIIKQVNNGNLKGIKNQRNVFFLLGLFGVFCTICVIIFSKQMILFIYGINFIEAYKITSILSLSLGLIFIQSVIQYFGVFNGFDKEIVRVQFITSIIKVLGFIIFIPIYKVQGVVFTILFAEIASFIMTIITYKKTIN